jgi:Iron-containing alcohol dehydrogenase.
MSFNMYVPTRFIFGCGRLSELHEQKFPGKKAMVVISNGKSSRENGSLDRTLKELSKAGVESVVFDKVQANPLKSTVMAGAKTAKDNGCDFIVALGGGSVMDASKAMAAMATNDGDIWDYINGGTGKGKALTNDPLPVVCITTTAGTGSEADQWGVITNDETNEKSVSAVMTVCSR